MAYQSENSIFKFDTGRLLDLVIYSREDGEVIDKWSAEHISDISMDTEWLTIVSDECIGAEDAPYRYLRDKVCFAFVGR